MTELKSTTGPIEGAAGNEGTYGTGLLNAYEAVKFAAGMLDPISENTVWEFPVYVNQDLYIEDGATLTIKSDVRIGAGFKIFVKKGGRLNIEGGHLNVGCDGERWGGIVVQGNPNYH